MPNATPHLFLFLYSLSMFCKSTGNVAGNWEGNICLMVHCVVELLCVVGKEESVFYLGHVHHTRAYQEVTYYKPESI